MDLFRHINWLAVLAAAVAAFLLGGLWFSPAMFAKQWMAALGKTKEQVGMPGPSMALSFVVTVVMATALAMIIARMPLLGLPGAVRLGGSAR